MNVYVLPRRWAEAFADSGLGGIRYEARFAPAPRPNSCALFGAAGQSDWPVDSSPVSGQRACEAAGLRVAAPPRLRQLRIDEP